MLCQCAARPDISTKTPPPVSSTSQARWDRVTPRLACSVPRDIKEKTIDWKFSLTPHRGRNARSWPDGRVEVTRGLLEFVRNDAELAAVLAHEMSHVTLRHGRARSARTWALLLGGAGLAVLAHHEGGNGAWESAAMGAGACLTLSLTGLTAFQRAQEFAADAESVSLLQRAGYPSSAAADFWEHYAAGRQAAGRSGGGWWKSHPPDAERVRRLRVLTEKSSAAGGNGTVPTATPSS